MFKLLYLTSQIKMNAMLIIHVLMRMLIVLILWGTTAASVIQDSLEMATTVQVYRQTI